MREPLLRKGERAGTTGRAFRWRSTSDSSEAEEKEGIGEEGSDAVLMWSPESKLGKEVLHLSGLDLQTRLSASLCSPNGREQPGEVGLNINVGVDLKEQLALSDSHRGNPSYVFP